MTDKSTQQDAENTNMNKDPDEWAMGDEPMTGVRDLIWKRCQKKPRSFNENSPKQKRRNESTNCSKRPDEASAAAARIRLIGAN